MFKHGSLFSGIGGFDLAAEWMGWENVFHCEWNPFGQRVLNYYWPKAKSYNDITKTDFSVHRGTIDVLTGGFPCQPYSVAGKQKGTADERHLWPEMLRAIREVQPPYVVGENVPGLVNWSNGMVFEQVQSDLEAEGYEVIPALLPACSTNAPHKRERIWFIAYSCSLGQQRSKEFEGINDKGISEGLAKRYEFNALHGNGNVANPERKGLQAVKQKELSRTVWDDKGGAAEQLCSSQNEYRGSFDNFPTKSPICNGDDGISREMDGIAFSEWRIESIKAGGNAIVPQVALQIFKAIEQFELLIK